MLIISGIHKEIRQSVHGRLAEGQWDEAEELCRESLLILEELCPVHTDVVIAICRLGWLLDRRRQWTEALDCAQRANEILDELGTTVPVDQRDTLRLDALLLQGVALRELGRYPKAERVLQRAVTLAEANREAPDLLVTACRHLALTYKLSGNAQQAACLFGLAILFATRAFGAVNAITAAMCYQLAALQFSRGRYQDGLTPAGQSLETRRTLLGPQHPDTAAAEALLLQLQNARESEAKARPRLTVIRAGQPPTLANTVTLTGLCGASA